MPSRRLSRCLAIALLCTAVGTAGPVAVAAGSSAGDQPDRLDRGQTPAVVTMGGGDEVRVTPVGRGGHRAVTALPRTDGTTPGLLLGSDESGTTVRTTDGSVAPTVLSGTGPSTLAASSTADPVELRFEAVGRDGRTASADVSVYDVQTGAVQAFRRIPGEPDAPCTADGWAMSSCLLVPPGTYSVMAFVNTMPSHRPGTARERTVQNVSLVGDPELEVSQARTFTFDARLADPVEARTPGHRTEVSPGGAMQLGYSRTSANGRTISRQLRPASMLDERFYMQPTAPVTVGALETLTRLRLEAPDIEIEAPGLELRPEYYEAVWFSDVSSDFPVFDGYARLPVVDVGHASPADVAGRDLRGAVAVAERSNKLSVAEQSNAAADAGAALVVVHNDTSGDNADPNGTGVKLRVPTVRMTRAEGLALKALPRNVLVGVRGESASPYVYDLVIKEDGGIPADLSYVFEPDDLAEQVRQVHGQPSIGSTFSEAAYQYQPGDIFSISTMFPFRGGARTRVEYRIPDPETRWTYLVATPETPYNHQFPQEPVLRMLLSDPDLQAYSRGDRTVKPVATAPIAPVPNPYRPFQRSGDRLRVAIAGFMDADGNHGRSYSTDSGMRTLLQIRADGELVGETDNLPSGVAALPSGSSTVEVSFRADNPQSWNQLSTHVESTWTLPSRTVPEGDVVTVPVMLADYDVPVDLRNRVRRDGSRVLTFGLELSHVEGSDPAEVREASLEASYDDGRTWRPATVAPTGGGRYQVALPDGNGFVSLRLHAADTAGSVLDQTIIRAFYVTR